MKISPHPGCRVKHQWIMLDHTSYTSRFKADSERDKMDIPSQDQQTMTRKRIGKAENYLQHLYSVKVGSRVDHLWASVDLAILVLKADSGPPPELKPAVEVLFVWFVDFQLVNQQYYSIWFTRPRRNVYSKSLLPLSIQSRGAIHAVHAWFSATCFFGWSMEHGEGRMENDDSLGLPIPAHNNSLRILNCGANNSVFRTSTP